ncbi:helix-turn-helix domain-containing protein [Kitasatospora sp. NPDC089797]|uniref:helix-turn-helix domain-containing protein n=1 Tax=Kitasatospora sp. NPDC089797 TaxID=3155298 RepID=UPI003438304A
MHQSDASDLEIWLTPREASLILKVAPQTLANWRALENGLPFTKLGDGPAARVRYSLRDIEAFMRRRRRAVA